MTNTKSNSQKENGSCLLNKNCSIVAPSNNIFKQFKEEVSKEVEKHKRISEGCIGKCHFNEDIITKLYQSKLSAIETCEKIMNEKVEVVKAYLPRYCIDFHSAESMLKDLDKIFGETQ